MSAAEIAAYIGAAAWLPQIGVWLYKWLAVPALAIYTERKAEIGFTSYGPIFNVRMAFLAQRKDLILDGFELELVHQDGDKRTLRWEGLQENLGETRDAAHLIQGRLTKDQVPIAIKVGVDSLVEKFVRFQEPHHNETVLPLIQSLVAQFNYLKRTDADYVAKTLNSKELLELVDRREKLFWWKPGNYEVTLVPASPKRFSFAARKYSFQLLATDVDQLKKNIQALKTDLENTVNSNLPEFKATEVSWNWAYAEIKRKA